MCFSNFLHRGGFLWKTSLIILMVCLLAIKLPAFAVGLCHKEPFRTFFWVFFHVAIHCFNLMERGMEVAEKWLFCYKTWGTSHNRYAHFGCCYCYVRCKKKPTILLLYEFHILDLFAALKPLRSAIIMANISFTHEPLKARHSPETCNNSSILIASLFMIRVSHSFMSGGFVEDFLLKFGANWSTKLWQSLLDFSVA